MSSSRSHRSHRSHASKRSKKTQRQHDLRTAVTPIKFTNERTNMSAKIRSTNPVIMLQRAQTVGETEAALDLNSTVQRDDVIYLVLEQIEQGSIGFTYKAKCQNGGLVRLRTEASAHTDLSRYKTIKMELLILKAYQDVKEVKKIKPSGHLPQLIDSGSTSTFNFIVTELMGDNLHDVTRKRFNRRAFSFDTAIRVAMQMISCLEIVHKLGFLHRFLRPQAFSHGLDKKIRCVMLSDFGLPLKFRNESNGTIYPPRHWIPMIGHIRYCSRPMHLNRELARRDDLESWIYLATEFFDLDALPWRDEMVSSIALDKKQKFVDGEFEEAFRLIDPEFFTIIVYIVNMKFHERPDYSYLMKTLSKIGRAKKIDWDVPYDWEVNEIEKPMAVTRKLKKLSELPSSSSQEKPQARQELSDLTPPREKLPKQPENLPLKAKKEEALSAVVKKLKSIDKKKNERTIVQDAQSRADVVIDVDMGTKECVNDRENQRSLYSTTPSSPRPSMETEVSEQSAVVPKKTDHATIHSADQPKNH